MHNLSRWSAATLITLCGILISSGASAAPKWRTAYYANQAPFSTIQPLSTVPWKKYTHVIQASIKPSNENGVPGINTADFAIDANKAAFVQTAHENGVKALVSLMVGGDEAAIMETVTNSNNVDQFVAVLAEFVNTNGYDGIDIDWEGLVGGSQYPTQFPNFIRRLRSALPNATITIAGEVWLRASYAEIHSQVDQINIMSYDLDMSLYTGATSPYTWFNTSVRHRPSADSDVANTNKTQERNLWYLIDSAQIPAAKIGLGVPLYGVVKQGLRQNSTDGVTDPDQYYQNIADAKDLRTQKGYRELLASDYWLNGIRGWSDTYKAPFISYNVAGSSNDAFVTYTDQQQLAESIALLNEKGLGGIMTFATTHEYLPDQTGDNRYPLSLAVHNTMLENPSLNVAYGRSATQSSTFSTASAARAVDGVTDGNYWNGSVTHTGSQAGAAWWELDLQTIVNINNIKIWNRTDCCQDRLQYYVVSILAEDRTVIWSETQSVIPNPSTMIAVGGVRGRYVKIDTTGTFSLAEVQVFPALQNVALNKPALQSDTAQNGNAERAVDGNTNGYYWANSTTHTPEDSNADWWKVNLLQDFNIGQIKIWNRTDCCKLRLSNYYVDILDANGRVVWSNFQVGFPDPSVTLYPGGIMGRYVKVYGPDILSLAEVQVIEY